MADVTTYNETIQTRQEEMKKTLIAALREMPIVQIACKKAGVGRATYYRWKNEDAAFLKESNEAIREGVELINDMSESQVIQLIREKKMPAISLWLKNNNPRYGGKSERRMPGSPIAELTPEDEKLFRHALALLSADRPKP
ncbi:MAG: phBC6A51 family helix-turn-helix protein [bacterium]|nr:phBC6A51 family helix-turn-helix protein [bacterium]